MRSSEAAAKHAARTDASLTARQGVAGGSVAPYLETVLDPNGCVLR